MEELGLEMGSESDSGADREVNVDVNNLNIEQLRFIVDTMGIDSYFKWDRVENGLIHKLGVKRVKNEINPSLPIIRSESMIIFENCVFDDFSAYKISGARFSNCEFKTWKGYKDLEMKKGDFELVGHDLPMTLWDSDGQFDYGYSSRRRCILPSTGTEFVKCELDPRIKDLMYALHKSFLGAETDARLIHLYEKLWLMEIQAKCPEAFNDFMDSLIVSHFHRALDLIEMSEEDYKLYRKVHDKFL